MAIAFLWVRRLTHSHRPEKCDRGVGSDYLTLVIDLASY
ncbi:hypothetical protein SPLC1_S541190 [Arthrospira platensis C1]|nr:hypothetical protein SPLC1_S541190 [Arthrospira platensis C1]